MGGVPFPGFSGFADTVWTQSASMAPGPSVQASAIKPLSNEDRLMGGWLFIFGIVAWVVYLGYTDYMEGNSTRASHAASE